MSKVELKTKVNEKLVITDEHRDGQLNLFYMCLEPNGEWVLESTDLFLDIDRWPEIVAQVDKLLADRGGEECREVLNDEIERQAEEAVSKALREKFELELRCDLGPKSGDF